MSVSVWEAVFMLVVLKIPMIYLAIVVWWAIRAEPDAGDGGEGAAALAPLVPCGWHEWKRRRPMRGSRRPIRPVTPRLRAHARAAA
jgi:hypothetical protein